MKQVSVIIPTLNGAHLLPALATALRTQTLQPVEWIVIDSGSTDGTREVATDVGATVLTISPGEFQHGRTRNLAAHHARGDILVFMSQDALPKERDCVERLVEAIPDEAAAAYARQIPRPEASRLESYARAVNYPQGGRTVTSRDLDRLGIRAVFFSNACSAVDRDIFDHLAGFPESTIANEDMLFASRLLRAGYGIRYAAASEVYHSHAYGPVRTFKRYFDIGVFFAQASAELPKHRLQAEGTRYAAGLLRHLVESGAWSTVPSAIIETTIKYVGQRLGSMYRRLPITVRRRLSMNAAYWGRTDGTESVQEIRA